MNFYIRSAIFLAELLDSRFVVGRFKFGIDPLLDFIPGIGNILSLMLALYIIWVGAKFNIPADQLGKMMTNVMFDFLLGFIPVVGQAGDFFFRANLKNIEILKRYMPNIVEGETVS
ncbi:DUF4112 domain-containing protein [Candidatus Daviesbacteria bacterium]|nr:DUF4112 domain-containing protein [Candidatus Daviesbacteria bacterium]